MRFVASRRQRSEEASPQQHGATREAEHARRSGRTTGVGGALSVDTRELVGVRRRADRTLGGADSGHSLGLGAPGTDLDEGVLLAVVRRGRLAGLDELLRPLVGQALSPVLELWRPRGGVRETGGQLARAGGRVGEAVGQLTGPVLELGGPVIELPRTVRERADSSIELAGTRRKVTGPVREPGGACPEVLGPRRDL